MWIISGIGRSGTSFVAEIFRHCGYYMGEFNKSVRAGYEDKDITRINKMILAGEFLDNNHIQEMVDLSSKPIVKDPRFMITIGHWLLAGAKIEGVLLCRRDIPQIMKSSAQSKAGLAYIFNGLFSYGQIGILESIEEALILTLEEYKVMHYDIWYPRSITEFQEVACLNHFVDDMAALKYAWQMARSKYGFH